MVKIGMLMSDRYEILERIGTGGMSDVYKAKDHKLNRAVAVKVLKQEFSENANFVSKFRVEAQAAAGLMHPNIVNVYDVGQEEGIYFIVMELVEGITLKKYIEKKARLSYKEAISIAIQVSMGIEAAHNNHIIHRDIKPQNIIISKEGKVKVTDFGIAKAATSNTITSNVMGSVHYTSPEQARGGYSDEKSDIYSLGITLFEMLTGRVPFNGETTVAIAIKHIQEQMPSPRDFVSEIPISVEQIVFKCTQKSPDRRYRTMGDLIVDLKHALMNPDEPFVNLDQDDEAGATKTIDNQEMSRIKKQVKARESLDDTLNLRTEKETIMRDRRKPAQSQHYIDEEYPEDDGYGDEYVDEYEYEDEYDDYEDYTKRQRGNEKRPKMEKITTIVAIVAAVIIALIVLFLVAKTLGLFDGSDSDKDQDEIQTEATQVQMIDVVGKSADAVKKALIEVGLTPIIEYSESSEYAEGQVMACSLKSDEVVPQGSEVTITVSMGETGVEVPDVVGLTEPEAVATLVNKGFVPAKESDYDDYIQEGSIFKQSPEGNSKAPAGTTITIYISKGPEETKKAVPDLLGKDEMTAMSMLTECGLELGNVSEVNNEDPSLEGMVCLQSIEPGTYVDEGTRVDVSVSIGPVESTYMFTETVSEPTIEEDPNYRGGTMVTVTIIAEDGTVLYSTQTSSFPIPQLNITGIKSPIGTVVFQYMNQGEASTVTNEDGTVTTVEGTSEYKEVKRFISFVAE